MQRHHDQIHFAAAAQFPQHLQSSICLRLVTRLHFLRATHNLDISLDQLYIYGHHCPFNTSTVSSSPPWK